MLPLVHDTPYFAGKGGKKVEDRTVLGCTCTYLDGSLSRCVQVMMKVDLPGVTLLLPSTMFCSVSLRACMLGCEPEVLAWELECTLWALSAKGTTAVSACFAADLCVTMMLHGTELEALLMHNLSKACHWNNVYTHVKHQEC